MEIETTKPHIEVESSSQMNEEWDEKEISALSDSIQSKDQAIHGEGVKKLKDLLIRMNFTQLESLVDKVVNAGILEDLAEIIKITDDFLIKFHAMWCFVNICCGNATHVAKALDTGILKLVFNIIDSALTKDPLSQEELDLTVECIWLLGNIAGDTVDHRDACLEHQAADKIVVLANKFPTHEKLIEHSVWSLQNIVSKKPAPFWNQILEAFKFLVSIIKDNKQPSKVIYYALWGICYISSSYPLDVVDSGIIPVLVDFMGNNENKIVFPALQTLGNLLSSTKDHYTDEVLKQPAFLSTLFKLTNSENARIKVYSTWALSNIAAGSPDQIAKIIENSEYIDLLTNQLKDSDDKIRYQASCVLANLVFRASISQIESLVVKNSYLEGLLEMMKQPELRVYERNFVEPINTILKHDSQHKFAPIFKQKGLVEQMQNIAGGLSFEMRGMAHDIINKHFLNIKDPVTAPTTTLLSAPAVSFVGVNSPAASPSKKDLNKSVKSSEKKGKDSEKKEKVSKVSASKKIKKPTKPKDESSGKKLIKRTKTMLATLKEAKALTRGVGVRGRTRKSARPAGEIPSLDSGKSSKIRRTGTMKQTLKEAKKILKQIDSTMKTKK